MRVDDYNFLLDESLIAQTPLPNRSESKLMVLDKKTNTYTHQTFSDIVSYFQKGDVLVLNNTKVLPSRIYGHKIDTNALIEMLLLKDMGTYYEVLAKPSRRLKEGTIIDFKEFKGKVIKKLEDGICHVEFIYEGIFLELLEKCGNIPLPPYIKEKLTDKSRYQTVYAKVDGSSASPTAGLHFTKEILDKLKEIGVCICEVTLHIGLGTFRPVSVSEVTNHLMHKETYIISEEVCNILNNAKKNSNRIIACGTTSLRCLEANVTKYKMFKNTKEETDIFIYPGYEFKAVDCLITNFHLPKSTLLMLVSAFSSKEFILNCYQEAINCGYRFFSFGDCMFIK